MAVVTRGMTHKVLPRQCRKQYVRKKARTAKQSVAAAELETRLEALDWFFIESEGPARATRRARAAWHLVLRVGQKATVQAILKTVSSRKYSSSQMIGEDAVECRYSHTGSLTARLFKRGQLFRQRQKKLKGTWSTSSDR